MRQDEVEGQVDGFVYRSVGSVGKLQGVQEGGGNGLEMGQNQALKWLHDYRCQRHWTVVIKSSHLGLLGDRDDSGGSRSGPGKTPERC